MLVELNAMEWRAGRRLAGLARLSARHAGQVFAELSYK
jgi:hypothetical protein